MMQSSAELELTLPEIKDRLQIAGRKPLAGIGVGMTVQSKLEEQPSIKKIDIRPLIKPKALLQDKFILLQSWQGVVEKRSENAFFVKLYDLTTKGIVEEAEISLDEVSREDLKLVAPGAIFYWNIGYRDSIRDGQRIRASEILFRRLPAWTEGEINEAEREAARISSELRWEYKQPPEH